jgi:release factor glutamine methyltransferase
MKSDSMKTAAVNRSTIRALLSDAERMLAAGLHPDKARRDAEELLLLALRSRVPGATRAWLIAHGTKVVAPDVGAMLNLLVERRLAGEPIQYIVGETEFYRMPFLVNRDVLIPRPETEHLVEKVVELAPIFRKPRIVDVGTGSGAIAISIAHEWPDAIVTATDISEAALRLAQRNAERLGFAKHVRFSQGDLLAPVAGEQFEIVVSNPPYVGEGDRETLSVEVRDYEPSQALFAGEEGLAVYRRLIPAAHDVLVAGGFVMLEMGLGQANAVGTLLENAGFSQIEFTADLQGILRVVSARRT